MSWETRELLAEVDALVSRLRREIDAHARRIDPSPEAIRARRRRTLRGDYRFFAWTYFPHHIRGAPSKFQAHFCARFPQLLEAPHGLTEWWQAPRGECKSTLLTKIGPCWNAVQALLQRPEAQAEAERDAPPLVDYVILFGAETKMPAKLLEVVKAELTINPALALDFPEVVGRGPVWKIGEFVTETGVRFESFGADQAVRGSFHGSERPKAIYGDDLIKDSEAKSPTECESRWDWYTRAIEYLGPPDGSLKALNVGTAINKNDPISRAGRTVGHVVHRFRAIERMPVRMDLWERCEELMRNDDRAVEEALIASDRIARVEDLPSYQFYLAHRDDMTRGAVTSWPEVRDLYTLMRQRAKRRRAFDSEMQGDPRSDEDKVFTQITFWVQRLPHWTWFGACDPSMGKGERGHPSALLAGGWDRQARKLHVAHAQIKRRAPTKLSADLIAMQREYGCQAVAFENNNAYEHMRRTFITDAIEAGVSLPLVGVTASVAPEINIESLEPFISGGSPRILFLSELHQLLDELADWPEPQPHHHYDGLTALYMLWMVAVSRGRGAPRVASTGRSGAVSLAGYD